MEFNLPSSCTDNDVVKVRQQSACPGVRSGKVAAFKTHVAATTNKHIRKCVVGFKMAANQLHVWLIDGVNCVVAVEGFDSAIDCGKTLRSNGAEYTVFVTARQHQQAIYFTRAFVLPLLIQQEFAELPMPNDKIGSRVKLDAVAQIFKIAFFQN